MISAHALRPFIRESNRIEGIHRDPTASEIGATQLFLELRSLMIGPLQDLVDVYQPGIMLRRHAGMNVSVGGHRPPLGGEHIAALLSELLAEINDGRIQPFQAHLRYEALHPVHGRQWAFRTRGVAVANDPHRRAR